MPVAPQNSGSGMKMVAGALALLAIGIGAFAMVLGMKNSETTTAAQSTPSTVFNIPSEINIPSLVDDDSPSTSPVVVNNPAPRVITVPGQAPVQQAPRQQQQPVADEPVIQGGQGVIQAQKDAEEAAAAAKVANANKAASLRAEAATLREQAGQMRADASLLSPDKEAVAQGMAAAQAIDDQAAAKEAEAAALGG
jgi:hypothetical protein